MLITRVSILSGIERTKDLDVTYDQLVDWERGGLAQDVFYNLNERDREFIMTGITDDEWDEFAGSDDEWDDVIQEQEDDAF